MRLRLDVSTSRIRYKSLLLSRRYLVHPTETEPSLRHSSCVWDSRLHPPLPPPLRMIYVPSALPSNFILEIPPRGIVALTGNGSNKQSLRANLHQKNYFRPADGAAHRGFNAFPPVSAPLLFEVSRVSWVESIPCREGHFPARP